MLFQVQLRKRYSTSVETCVFMAQHDRSDEQEFREWARRIVEQVSNDYKDLETTHEIVLVDETCDKFIGQNGGKNERCSY